MSDQMKIISPDRSDRPTQQGGRRNFLINPKFQLSFLAYTIGVSVLTICFFYAADAYFFWKFQQLGQGLGLPSNHVFFQFIDEQRSAKNMYYAVAAVVTVSVLGAWGLLLSHHVAGPLYRLRKHLMSVATGETMSDVRFRKGDFFQEVADAYNIQMKRYREAATAAGMTAKDQEQEQEHEDKNDSAAA
jgi:hypothetical protein